MMTFIGICAAAGLLLLLLDQGAKYSSVAPSMYRSDLSGTGWLIIIVAAVAALCVGFLP